MPFDTISGKEVLQNCAEDFDVFALRLYRYQYERNELYRAYNEALNIEPEKIRAVTQIPFLPISFFKSHRIGADSEHPDTLVFESSGTTGMQPSKHYVRDIALYEAIALAGFEQFYGAPQDWVVLALLPSYLERKTSSLVHMSQLLMQQGGQPESGFYLNEYALLQEKIKQLQAQNKKILLLGVTFALIDFATQYPMDLSGVVVMETGGMKGRQAEWTREKVHQFLQEQWQLEQVHSEYGMTELLSQAYGAEAGIFRPISSMRALVRDVQDPLETKQEGSGALNIIDLANVHSCAFIATEDMGKVYADNSFEVLGRMDFAALRGCSLMAV